MDTSVKQIMTNLAIYATRKETLPGALRTRFKLAATCGNAIIASVFTPASRINEKAKNKSDFVPPIVARPQLSPIASRVSDKVRHWAISSRVMGFAERMIGRVKKLRSVESAGLAPGLPMLRTVGDAAQGVTPRCSQPVV
jgi:hypothetical protein